jgi:formylmethanofuran dehydrogenase subunit C
MSEIILTIKRELTLPITATEISPNKFTGKSATEIENIKVWQGNRQVALQDIFKITEQPDGGDETVVKVVGNASKIRGIGTKTSSGSLMVEGNAGMYLGQDMSGGSIVVSGDAASWLGMRRSDRGQRKRRRLRGRRLPWN